MNAEELEGLMSELDISIEIARRRKLPDLVRKLRSWRKAVASVTIEDLELMESFDPDELGIDTEK